MEASFELGGATCCGAYHLRCGHARGHVDQSRSGRRKPPGVVDLAEPIAAAPGRCRPPRRTCLCRHRRLQNVSPMATVSWPSHQNRGCRCAAGEHLCSGVGGVPKPCNEPWSGTKYRRLFTFGMLSPTLMRPSSLMFQPTMPGTRAWMYITRRVRLSTLVGRLLF